MHLTPTAFASALLLASLQAAAAPVAAPAASAAPAAAEPVLAYTVAPGDTLIGLNTTLFAVPGAWPQVARLNRLPDANRIRPGQVLQVPVRLLRSERLAATVISVEGDVRINGRAAQVGDLLAVGETLRTDAHGSAVVRLAEGTRLRLDPDTAGTLDEHRRFQLKATAAAADTGLIAGALRLVHGSLEVFATKVLRARPLEVSTPTAVIGVRGTEYRVRHEGTDTATEVLEGRVHVDLGQAPAQAPALPAAHTAPTATTAGTAGTAGTDLAAGFGALARPGRLQPPEALPAAPDLAWLPALWERPLLRIKPPAGTPPLRVQVASDATFDHLVRDERVAPGGELRVADLADGRWYVRARQISPGGLEGLDGVRSFQLKARPEPPAAISPIPGAKLPRGPVPLQWARNLEAEQYAVQVSASTDFSQPVWQGNGLRDMQATFTPAADDLRATWFWRLRSVRPGGDAGPWGDPQSFQLRPLPQPPSGGVSEDGKTLTLAWGGRDEDRFQVELARDEAFTQDVQQAGLATPRWSVARPALPGRWYFRYRSVEPDGFVTPWSSTLSIEVPRDWAGAGWLLLPLLGALL